MNDLVFLTSLLIVLIYLVIKSKKAMHMLQQNLYNENNRYLKWINKNKKTVFLHYDFFFLVIAIFNVILENKFVLLVSLLILIYDAYLIRKIAKTEQVKKPLVITARVKRLIVTTSILYLIPISLMFINNSLIYTAFMILGLMTYFNYYVLLFAKFINKPVEKCVYRHFYKLATNKLYNSRCEVIGITGSYGKTSSKNILGDILNVKYMALKTPRNLNTEYGLMITINNHMDKFDEFFIAEMGAYQKGEIKTLCDMVKPKYGILTKIGTAHLESFGSEKNIEDTKFELIESLPEDDGIAILNMDDEKQSFHDIKNICKKIWIGITDNEADVRAINIKCTNKGSNFDIIFKGDKNKYHFETKLLGNNNIYNILASVALGRELGMTIEELQTGVRKVNKIEHRLELKQIGNIYMIDDAYNSNPVGAKGALDVLDMMDGTKVVVTPGMIELGEKQDEYNYEFGKQIAKVADYTILVGEKITKSIYQGLLAEDYDEEKIIVINDVKKAFDIINGLKSEKKDIYALFENDLPDSYNE